MLGNISQLLMTKQTLNEVFTMRADLIGDVLVEFRSGRLVRFMNFELLAGPLKIPYEASPSCVGVSRPLITTMYPEPSVDTYSQLGTMG